MAQIKLYNRDGNVTGEMAMPEFLLTAWNPGMVHQVFKSIAANKRKPTAHTKDRSEVSGGGIKPWRQKGTGNARHGSSRSPIWRHGGVTFGPRNTTDFSQKINSGMLKQSLLSALSQKAAAEELKVVSELKIGAPKTKELAKITANLAGKNSVLLVVNEDDNALMRAAANLERTNAVKVNRLNAYDILTHKYVLMDQSVLNKLTS